MTIENIYWYASILIFLPWALLIFAPKWKYTEPISFGAAFFLLLAAAYFTYQFLRYGDEGGSLFTVEGIAHLFRNQEMLTIGWLNALSFSLCVGIWQVHDARAEKIPHLMVAPCLAITLLAGPSGLLLYLLVRWAKTRKWQVG